MGVEEQPTERWAAIESGSFISFDELSILFALAVPILVIGEILTLVARGQFAWRNVKVPLMILVTNGVIARFFALAVATKIASYVQPHALIQTDFTWYWFIYGYLVWEFSHFVYHWLGHKVRLLWCLHSSHHAPEHMNLTVSYSHFFLEAPYADLVRIGICTLMGLDPVVLLIIIGIDAIWGSLIHVSEEVLPDGRMGFLEKFLLTPSHHRLHHARNAQYIDTNFCNLLNVWDRLFGTYQEQLDEALPDYGIKRPMNSHSFWDVYLGEFVALAHDIGKAPRWQDKLLYLIMPPHWKPLRTQEHRNTA